MGHEGAVNERRESESERERERERAREPERERERGREGSEGGMCVCVPVLARSRCPITQESKREACTVSFCGNYLLLAAPLCSPMSR